MESKNTQKFVDALFAERSTEAEPYRGAFDKGVDSYFMAASSISYTLGEALAVEMTENVKEFVTPDQFDPQGLHMIKRFTAYVRGVNASMKASEEYKLNDNQRDIVHSAYLDRLSGPQASSGTGE